MAGNEEGIYERKDGRFEARFIVSHGEDGRAKYKAVYGRSRAEVREKLAAAKKELLGEQSFAEGKTFREVAEKWLQDAGGKIAQTTCGRYADALERDVYPEYADTPMKDVTEAEMERFLLIAPELAKKKGRMMEKSSLQVVKAVMSNIIQYANADESRPKADVSGDVNSYEELSPQEIEMICLKAKHNHCPEMLAALLSLFCGMRTGELCALKGDDVDGTRHEIYIHETAHRIRNPEWDGESRNKTVVIVEEMPRKKHIRRVKYPEILSGYIDGFRKTGMPLIRSKDEGLLDPRTLENLLKRIMLVFRMENMNFERLRKTYRKGMADEKILNNIFLGIHPDDPYRGSVDMEWLVKEMGNDLTPLRLLIGLTPEEMGNIIGMSSAMYRQIENGSRDLTWDQYMSALFMFHYNMRTADIVSSLGLYPDSLKSRMKIGED